MHETANDNSSYDSILPERPLSPAGEPFLDEEPHLSWEAAAEQKAAFEGWLDRRGILEDTPRFTMSRRESRLLQNVGIGGDDDSTLALINETKQDYGIPLPAQYAWVNTLSDITRLISVNEDFGTVIDEERIEGLDVQPEDTPHITVTARELELFGTVGVDSHDAPSVITDTRELYGMTQDQCPPRYALVDIESDDPNLPNEPLLMMVDEENFWTAIDRDTVDKDLLASGPGPDDPLIPESGGMYRTINIADTLRDASDDVRYLAMGLMDGITTNPLEGRYWVRAGDPTGQKDAYVWENGRPFTNAVELAIAFPSQYESVCVVVGDRRDPANNKPLMAQLDNPTVVLKIEGDELEGLKRIYKELYHEPDYALSAEQRERRDEVFNYELSAWISNSAYENEQRKLSGESTNGGGYSQPRVRYHE